MAMTGVQNWFDVTLEASRTFFHQKRDAFRKQRARRAAFRNTVNELSKLSNRDLADLGIARSSIRRLAWQAANDV